jgi:hypothetical protein
MSKSVKHGCISYNWLAEEMTAQNIRDVDFVAVTTLIFPRSTSRRINRYKDIDNIQIHRIKFMCVTHNNLA